MGNLAGTKPEPVRFATWFHAESKQDGKPKPTVLQLIPYRDRLCAHDDAGCIPP